jgi:hypothetical protein
MLAGERLDDYRPNPQTNASDAEHLFYTTNKFYTVVKSCIFWLISAKIPYDMGYTVFIYYRNDL